MLYPVELRALDIKHNLRKTGWSGQRDSNSRPSAPKQSARKKQAARPIIILGDSPSDGSLSDPARNRKSHRGWFLQIFLLDLRARKWRVCFWV
jgi:hypothetical protein